MGEYFARHKVLTALTGGILALGLFAGGLTAAAERGGRDGRLSDFLNFSAPAGNRPATTDTVIDGVHAAVLPNGRLVTPAGTEVNVQAPKPFGMALSPDGRTLATLNSGAGPFSLTLITQLASAVPVVKRIDINASFMGVTFSPDSQRLYLSGGENGNVWIADANAGRIVGSVNLNGAAHPLDRPLDVLATPLQHFKGAFPGNMALASSGRFLYVVDQGGFKVHVIDTSLVLTGVDAQGRVTEPDNFAAVVGRASVGRYPFGIGLTASDRTLLVTHVGVFQYTHLRPASPTGNPDVDYPLCFPGAGYPDETKNDRVITIDKVDPRNLPDSLQDADGIRCGYVPASRLYTVPGLGSPNAPESSSVYVLDVSNPRAPQRREIVKTGPLVGESDEGIAAYSGSHPNAVVAGADAIYVANGNNDSISILDPQTYAERGRIGLSLLRGQDRALKGLQPVSLALSPDERTLYAAEAGINAIGVIRVDGKGGRVVGHIPTGWWPSSVQVSTDGRTLYVANARGRGAGPNLVGESRSPKFSVLGTVNIIATPGERELDAFTDRVVANNGFADDGREDRDGDGRGRDRDRNPIPSRAGQPSAQIKHVVFINKENATHDLIFGDITQTRKGVPVNGEPAFSLGADACPNHHELALRFAFSDNFFLEPSVSSDGHRWLTGQYTTESEETHWPASYGGRRQDSGDDPAVIRDFPGRIGFTDANASPEPNDLNEHGGMFLHLTRQGKSVVNFGNGFEFAVIDEPGGAEPTGAREHANVPMEKVVRDNSDHLFPTFNTHIPDAPLPEESAAIQPLRSLQARIRDPVRRSRARHLPAAELRRLVLPERSRRRRARHQPGGAGVVVPALRPGQRRRARSDRRADLEQPVLEGHRDLRRRGRHAERRRSRRRPSLDLPGDQPVGEEAVREQGAHEPGEHLQDGESDPRPAAAESVRRGRHRPARPVHEHARLQRLQRAAGVVRDAGESAVAGADGAHRLQPARSQRTRAADRDHEVRRTAARESREPLTPLPSREGFAVPTLG